jgi:hypothetical protein
MAKLGWVLAIMNLLAFWAFGIHLNMTQIAGARLKIGVLAASSLAYGKSWVE